MTLLKTPNFGKIRCTIAHGFFSQDDLLVGVIFGEFACGKKLADFIFYIGNCVPHAIEHAQIEINDRFYISDFLIVRQSPILIPCQ